MWCEGGGDVGGDDVESGSGNDDIHNGSDAGADEGADANADDDDKLTVHTVQTTQQGPSRVP